MEPRSTAFMNENYETLLWTLQRFCRDSGIEIYGDVKWGGGVLTEVYATADKAIGKFLGHPVESPKMREKAK